MKKHLILVAGAFTLAACSEPPAPPPEVPQNTIEDSRQVEEVGQNVSGHIPEQVLENDPEPVYIHIEAPAGQYKADPLHSNLYFSVTHLGVSNYLMRFTDFDVTVDLDPDDLSASSVNVTIDPSSIRTDFDGDYVGNHPDSPFTSWEEDLSMSEHFLNTGEYPVITFTSSRVTPTDEGTLDISGNLELLGQTQLITLEAHVVGSASAHPFTGAGLIGFSATGTFNRSDFGMTHLINPPIVGDAVTFQIELELLQEQDKEEAPESDDLS